jgi:predicted XRE-type DNA-binding protein
MKRKNVQKEELEYEVGSENVFADLGFENPEEELLKSDLTAEIAKIIKKKRLTQIQAAGIMGVDQPRISSLLRGRLDLFSLEMLMHFLNALGQDVEIVVKPKPRNRKLAHLSVYVPSSDERNAVPMAAKASSRGM